jgi:hypothetical protein
MQVAGLVAGPKVGDMLEAAREAQVTGDLASRTQALSWLERRVADESGSS